MNIESGDFESLLLASIPLIDVRAPIEFQVGAIPGAINLPILNDDERKLVGTTYKQQGRETAISLGHDLISGSVKQERVETWLKAVQLHPNAVIYCFRGGLRSQITQQWLAESGFLRPLVKGGYKALRNFLLQILEERIHQVNFKMIRGPTGSGKTEFLQLSGQPYLDLESLARHRGSAFGAMESPQPSQIDFENALALAILRLPKDRGTILVENESRMIGRCAIPELFFKKMKESPVQVVEKSLDDRVENIYRDYILNSSLGRDGSLIRFNEFRQSVQAISRKLGGLRSTEILKDLDFAQSEFEQKGLLDSNRIWIRKLLEWYYDPLYRRN